MAAWFRASIVSREVSTMTWAAWAGLMAQLLGRVRRKMLSVGLPAVLNDLDDVGTLRPASTFRPRFTK